MADNYLRAQGTASSNYLAPYDANTMTGWDYTKREPIYDPIMARMQPEGLQADAPYNPVERFAGPASMAPPLDRQSQNVETPSMLDFALASLKQPFANRVNMVTQVLPHLARSYLLPTPTMQEIGDLLPKQDHWAGESDWARKIKP